MLILNKEQTCEFMPILNGATIRRSSCQEKRVRKKLQQQEGAVGESAHSFGDWCQLYILLSDALIPQKQVLRVNDY